MRIESTACLALRIRMCAGPWRVMLLSGNGRQAEAHAVRLMVETTEHLNPRRQAGIYKHRGKLHSHCTEGASTVPPKTKRERSTSEVS